MSVVTTICFGLLMILSLTEISRYFTVETRSDMLVDIAPTSEKLHVNIDILFPKLPCEIISLDVQNVLGSHEVDVQGSLHKHRLDQNGNLISSKEVAHGPHAAFDRGAIARDTQEQI
jgi:endoplasmic reticulum-Golgi intermediate compartment protein 3